jgi:hypothetical protein
MASAILAGELRVLTVDNELSNLDTGSKKVMPVVVVARVRSVTAAAAAKLEGETMAELREYNQPKDPTTRIDKTRRKPRGK